MGKRTGIEWTDHTWNTAVGCHKVSDGCRYCYAEFIVEKRMGKDFRIVKQTLSDTFNQPLKWAKEFPGDKVFANSISDFFHVAQDEWRDQAWDIIRRTPELTYQILTKRPERIADHLPTDWGRGWDHVWLGVSAESQKWLDERASVLLEVPAKTRFLSCEPLLGPLDLNDYLDAYPIGDYPQTECAETIDWVIVGGESGPKARAMDTSWVGSLVRQCRSYGVPIFVKQLGSVWAKSHKPTNHKGGDMQDWAPALAVREFPKARV